MSWGLGVLIQKEIVRLALDFREDGRNMVGSPVKGGGRVGLL